MFTTDDYAVKVSLEDWRRVPRIQRENIYALLTKYKTEGISTRYTEAAADLLKALAGDV